MSFKEDEVDPFDTVLTLEDQFYQEGYALGIADGHRAGLIEGRAFGLEKGFEKYLTMGKAHGRAEVWAGRLPSTQKEVVASQDVAALPPTEESGTSMAAGASKVPKLPASARLEAHVRTLYALTEVGSLSTANSEDSVAEFDDRMKRAEGKIKVIERITGESGSLDVTDLETPRSSKQARNVDASIEDISVLHARH